MKVFIIVKEVISSECLHFRSRRTEDQRGKVPVLRSHRLAGAGSMEPIFRNAVTSGKERRAVGTELLSALPHQGEPRAYSSSSSYTAESRVSNLETIKENDFHRQGTNWRRLLPGGLSGPLPAWLG
jgi:hypothetical protein